VAPDSGLVPLVFVPTAFMLSEAGVLDETFAECAEESYLYTDAAAGHGRLSKELSRANAPLADSRSRYGLNAWTRVDG
jgi:hypothetical protein